MNAQFQQHYAEQLKLLPSVNQAAIQSFDWLTNLLNIGKKYALQLDELEDLQIETMLIMVGLADPAQYQDELMNRLALSPTEAGKLVDDVNEHIFMPIHDYIVRGGPETVNTDELNRSGISVVSQESMGDIMPEPSRVVPTSHTETPQPVIAPVTATAPATGSSPMRIEPTPTSSVAPVEAAHQTSMSQDIIEHKLANIFDETPETITHL